MRCASVTPFHGEPRRAPTLILTGDDFGASQRANAAIIRAHTDGVLTAASLMVTGSAVVEAVVLARAHPGLRVGLHLVLVDGRSALEPDRLPGLVDKDRAFARSPFRQGVRYGLVRGARARLAGEIRAQFERFAATKLALDHVDGHHHLHMHPVAWPLVVAEAERFGAAGVRITRDDLGLTLRWNRRGMLARTAHAGVLGRLARHCRGRLEGRGLRCLDRTYGVVQPGGMTEAYLLWLVEHLPPSDAEIVFHPGAGAEDHSGGGTDPETQALMSAKVRSAIAERGFRLGGYAELIGAGPEARPRPPDQPSSNPSR